ncbi:MAG: ferredoxin [Pseudonocardiales bacterium]
MKISVDRDRCEGHGLCEHVAPELFQFDDQGDLILLFDGQDIPKEQRDLAVSSVHICPVAALKMEN